MQAKFERHSAPAPHRGALRNDVNTKIYTKTKLLMPAAALISDASIPTRQSLLSRLRDWSDHDSWKEFFEIYWKLIYSAAIKSGLNDAEAQDVVQETIVAISKSMPAFKYDREVGSFKGYLLKQTSWRIKDQFRKRLPEATFARDRDSETSLMDHVADPNGFVPESYWDAAWERNLVEVAHERVKKKVHPKHYQIFDLHAIQQWPPRKVANRMRVRAAFVYLVKYRIARLLAKEIKQLQAEEHNENHRR